MNYKNSGSTKIRIVLLHSQHFYNNFTTNLMCLAVNDSNLGQILILFFHPPITAFCIRFIVKML